MQKLKKTELNRWLKEPATLHLIQSLEQLLDNVIYSCGNGGCIPPSGDSRTLQEYYAEAQGAKDILNTVLDCGGDMEDENHPLKSFMYYTDNIEDDEDGE